MARVSRKRRNSGEMASDALWIISFKCVVKGYKDCRVDVKEGEDFRVLKKIGEKGRAFRIVNERLYFSKKETLHVVTLQLQVNL